MKKILKTVLLFMLTRVSECIKTLTCEVNHKIFLENPLKKIIIG